MVRPALVFVLVSLAACGNTPAPRDVVSPVAAIPADLATAPRFASGPVGTACLIHNRPGSDARLCGCIQAAADLTLSQSEQQRSVRFFTEPELLNEIKISDTPANERFWAAWDRFSETAEEMCSGI